MGDTARTSLTMEEYAQVVFIWLSHIVERETRRPIYWSFTAWLPRNRRKYRSEQTAVEMWIILDLLDNLVRDRPRLQIIMEILHRAVYDQLPRGTTSDFSAWRSFLGQRYREYAVAFTIEDSRSPFYVVGMKLIENLYGRPCQDPAACMKAMARIALSRQYFAETMARYEVV
jgi:hypothetical protein